MVFIIFTDVIVLTYDVPFSPGTSFYFTYTIRGERKEAGGVGWNTTVSCSPYETIPKERSDSKKNFVDDVCRLL